MTGRRGFTRSVAAVGVAALAVVGLAACNRNEAGPNAFSQTVKGQGGRKSSVKFGAAAKIPKDFPASVPLPDVGDLRAIAAEKSPPNQVFTMTYSLGGRNGNDAGNEYRSRLQRAGYRIEHFSSVGGTDGDLIQFDAIGKRWDVSVVSGKATPRDRSTMSVQVKTHGSVDSGISGIGDTTPDIDTGAEPPSGGSSTTTTTTG